jgi:SAM-dependent methyltransferase
MKDFGAQSVNGVDISESAIEKAKELFSSEGVEYFQADANRVGCVVEGKYDLIVSFETIEHLKNPEVFLVGIKKLLNKDGIIVISCPNDYIAMEENERNPYHEKKYSLQEFQALTEATLGIANQWLFGVNVQGYAVVSHDDALINDEWISPSDILKSKIINESHLIPSQSNIRPKSTNVLFYIGVWGKCASLTSSALSAQSYAAFVEPWKALDWFRNEVARLESIIKTQGSK